MKSARHGKRNSSKKSGKAKRVRKPSKQQQPMALNETSSFSIERVDAEHFNDKVTCSQNNPDVSLSDSCIASTDDASKPDEVRDIFEANQKLRDEIEALKRREKQIRQKTLKNLRKEAIYYNELRKEIENELGETRLLLADCQKTLSSVIDEKEQIVSDFNNFKLESLLNVESLEGEILELTEENSDLKSKALKFELLCYLNEKLVRERTVKLAEFHAVLRVLVNRDPAEEELQELREWLQVHEIAIPSRRNHGGTDYNDVLKKIRADYETSTSWRLTKPLRDLKQAFVRVES